MRDVTFENIDDSIIGDIEEHPPTAVLLDETAFKGQIKYTFEAKENDLKVVCRNAMMGTFQMKTQPIVGLTKQDGVLYEDACGLHSRIA